MPEQILGLPAGMAVRRLGFEPTAWQARMELRAQVVRGLDKAQTKRKARRPRSVQTGDTRKDVR